MRWYYKLLEKGVSFYLYSYSRESKTYDGVIRYDTRLKSSAMLTPCVDDAGSKLAQDMALNHFWKVIKDNFPDERSVCCG